MALPPTALTVDASEYIGMIVSRLDRQIVSITNISRLDQLRMALFRDGLQFSTEQMVMELPQCLIIS